MVSAVVELQHRFPLTAELKSERLVHVTCLVLEQPVGATIFDGTETCIRQEALMSQKPRTYQQAECLYFRKTSEPFGELSNLAGGFPIFVQGLTVETSEALYQALKFPHREDVQALVLQETAPMAAKRCAVAHAELVRPDWVEVRVRVMMWCLRAKLACNWETFGSVLQATGDRTIVEWARHDPYWGAVPDRSGRLVGSNALGRLLMALRTAHRGANADRLRIVAPPKVKEFSLLGQALGVVGSQNDPS
jgi:ribA/ribD-fused uncharacterized protein